MVPYPHYLAGKGWLEATETRGEVGAAGSFSLRSAPCSAAQVGMVAARDLAAAGLREAGGSHFPAKPFPKKSWSSLLFPAIEDVSVVVLYLLSCTLIAGHVAQNPGTCCTPKWLNFSIQGL